MADEAEVGPSAEYYINKGRRTRRSLKREATEAGRMAAYAIGRIPEGYNVYEDHDINEKHLADAVAETCGRYIRHCPQIGWMAYNAREGRWTDLYAESAVEGIVKHFGELLLEGANENDAQEVRFARHILSSGGITAVKKILSMDASVAVEFEMFDADPAALNCMGDYYNLRTGESRPAEPEDMFSATVTLKAAPLEKARGRGCGAWEMPEISEKFAQYLDKATSKDGKSRPDLAYYLLSYFGYALTGETGASFFVNFHGQGKNGKSVLLSLMLELFGGYAAPLPKDIVIENQFQSQFDLDALVGKRLGVLMDAPEGRLNMDQLKTIVDGGAMNGKRKHKKDFTFKSQCKIAVGSNPRLTLKDTGMAVRRRVRMAPFDYTVPDGEEVPNLHKILLKEEGPQILSLLIWFANQYYANGEGPKAFPPCAVVDEASAEYMASEDLVGRWKGERTEAADGCAESAAALYKDFRRWADGEGVRKVISKNKFGEYLTIHIPNKIRKDNGIYYNNIRLKEPPGSLPADGGG